MLTVQECAARPDITNDQIFSLKKKQTAKKGHNSVKILQMTPKFQLDLYFTMIHPSVNYK